MKSPKEHDVVLIDDLIDGKIMGVVTCVHHEKPAGFGWFCLKRFDGVKGGGCKNTWMVSFRHGDIVIIDSNEGG